MKSFLRRVHLPYSNATSSLPQAPNSPTHTESAYPPASSFAAVQHLATTIPPRTVIELFQSQGCNSCPPTNANLLSNTDPNTIVLTYNVTYWDHLGWRDTFGNRAFDDRQRDYVTTLGLRSSFTPQVIVNGRASGVGNTLQGLDKVLMDGKQVRESAGVRVQVEETPNEDGVIVRVSAQDVAGDPQHKLEVWRVLYDPQVRHVKIQKGENRGRVLPHRNVVVSLERIGDVTCGKESVWRIGNDHPGFESLVLVQDGPGGPIVGAATVGCTENLEKLQL